ncbi:MAG: ADP-ribosylation factor-like protein, partial [bacterium]
MCLGFRPYLPARFKRGNLLLIIRFVKGNFGALHEPTIGALFLSKTVKHKDYTARLTIWDTAGQEKYKSMVKMYYKNANAAVVV